MQILIQHVEDYILSKKYAWSETTQRSEKARLLANLDLINKGPAALYEESKLKPYTLKTLFIRAGELQSFIGDTSNSFKRYLKANALMFKNSYVRVKVPVTYEEARSQLAKLKDPKIKKVAVAILNSGLRASEAINYDGSGEVLGKGAKMRDVFVEENLKAEGVTYTKLYRALKPLGLKPHDLRKLAATKLAGSGLREADLMAVFGWTSLQTASYYLQSKQKDELKALVNSALK